MNNSCAPYITYREIFAKVPRSYAKERAKVKVHFEGDGPVGLTDINPIRAHLHVYKAIMKYEVSMTI